MTNSSRSRAAKSGMSNLSRTPRSAPSPIMIAWSPSIILSLSLGYGIDRSDHPIADDATAVPAEILHLERQIGPHRRHIGITQGGATQHPDLTQRFEQPAPDPDAHLAGVVQLPLDELGDANGLQRARRRLAIAGDDEGARRRALRLQPFPAGSGAVTPGGALGDDPFTARLAHTVEKPIGTVL